MYSYALEFDQAYSSHRSNIIKRPHYRFNVLVCLYICTLSEVY